MMQHWRVTKYNPVYRDDTGAYTREEWISFDDVGFTFNGTVLTLADYTLMEDRYVNTALHFAREANRTELVVSEFELGVNNVGVSEGMVVDINKASQIIREILRGHIWCKLEYPSTFYLHFGYDYYMYIGNEFELPRSINFAKNCGLFVEEYVSPYLR